MNDDNFLVAVLNRYTHNITQVSQGYYNHLSHYMETIIGGILGIYLGYIILQVMISRTDFKALYSTVIISSISVTLLKSSFLHDKIFMLVDSTIDHIPRMLNLATGDSFVDIFSKMWGNFSTITTQLIGDHSGWGMTAIWIDIKMFILEIIYLVQMAYLMFIYVEAKFGVWTLYIIMPILLLFLPFPNLRGYFWKPFQMLYAFLLQLIVGCVILGLSFSAVTSVPNNPSDEISFLGQILFALMGWYLQMSARVHVNNLTNIALSNVLPAVASAGVGLAMAKAKLGAKGFASGGSKGVGNAIGIKHLNKKLTPSGLGNMAGSGAVKGTNLALSGAVKGSRAVGKAVGKVIDTGLVR